MKINPERRSALRSSPPLVVCCDNKTLAIFVQKIYARTQTGTHASYIPVSCCAKNHRNGIRLRMCALVSSCPTRSQCVCVRVRVLGVCVTHLASLTSSDRYTNMRTTVATTSTAAATRAKYASCVRSRCWPLKSLLIESHLASTTAAGDSLSTLCVSCLSRSGSTGRLRHPVLFRVGGRRESV